MIDESAHGVEVWVHPYAKTSGKLAEGILKGLEDVGIQRNRGVKKGFFAVLNSNVPSVMIELGFVPNKKDNELFDKHVPAYAKAIAEELCKFIKVDYKEEVVDRIYRVQLGAFTYHANATAYVKELQQKEFEAFVSQGKDYYRVQLGAFTQEKNARGYLKEVRAKGLDAFLVPPTKK